MSDVWRELEERLKQKAKTFAQIDYLRNLDLDKAVEHDLDPSQLCAINNKWMLSKWVRLEDVQKLIEQLKQKYVLIPKKKLMEKLAEIKLYGTKINGQLSDKPEYSPRYLADFIEKELLKE